MLTLREEQVLGFRARRLGLNGEGHADVVAAARAQVGGQAQVLNPTVQGLAMRTAHRPTAHDVKHAMLAGRDVVRAWGQRDTIHVYDPADWPWVVAARADWGKSGRRALDDVDDQRVDEAAAHLATFDRPVRRTDFKPLVDDAWLARIPDDYFDTYDKKWRFCTGRLIWHLGNRGLLSHDGKDGSEQLYAPRSVAFPDLDFSAAHTDAPAAAAHLARRYLRAYGPATVQDLAHFFGANVSSARDWAERMPDVLEVRCKGRELLAAAEDEDALQAGPAEGVRLLPGYDNLLMGHADKSWTVPVEAERKEIWRKAAVVAAIVWDAGRAVATWKHKVRSKYVTIEITPLSGWSGQDVSAAAQEVAEHLGRSEARVTFQS